jgi:hypothetical protein
MVQYAVAQKDAEWTLFRDGTPIRRGLSRSAAIELAEMLAFRAEAAGDEVEILIQGYTGELTERHSGRRKP